MPKTFAFILLVALTAVHYGRHLAYLDCQLSNAWNADAGKCDCEKVLTKTSTPGDILPIAVHQHLHPNDYFSSVNMYRDIEILCTELKSSSPTRISPICDGVPHSLDRPPNS